MLFLYFFYDVLIYMYHSLLFIRSVGRVYAGWGLSQPFYRQELWKTLGYNSLEDFLVGFWEGFFLKRDANNLLAMLWTWQNADISDNHIFKGDLTKALEAITSPCLIMPAKIDLYFPPEDNEWEAARGEFEKNTSYTYSTSYS